MTKKYFGVFLCLFVATAYAESSSSILSSITESAKSVVHITAETSGAFKDKPVGIIDQNTGMVLVRQPIRVVQYNRQGAGVILDSSGIIATNNHTVTNAGKIMIKLADGTVTTANILAAYPDDDIAILKINSTGPLPAIQLADTQKIKTGDTVYAIGNSPMLKDSICEGKITGVGMTESTPSKPSFVGLIRIDFNVYQGDSGVPILDRKGHLIGIIVAREKIIDKMSYAIPANIIEKRYREYLSSAVKQSK